MKLTIMCVKNTYRHYIYIYKGDARSVTIIVIGSGLGYSNLYPR